MLIRFGELPIPFGRLAPGMSRKNGVKYIVTEEWLREVFSQAVRLLSDVTMIVSNHYIPVSILVKGGTTIGSR